MTVLNSLLRINWYFVLINVHKIVINLPLHHKSYYCNSLMNRINSLFNVKYPIIQGGMVWCSGWRLASAVSNYGGLGIIGAGSMYPDVLKNHIEKYKAASSAPFAVNLPLLYPHTDQHIETILKEKVPIVFTSAGNPKTWTQILKSEGCKVVHVISSVKFAQKAQNSGVDAVVAEGFEAGGHNGREETTTLCLLPMVRKSIDVPLIAAGGIASGKAMLAAMNLGADGVQIGSRFATSIESSAHDNYKTRIVEAKEGDTALTLKEVTPVRMIKNNFYDQIKLAYNRGASVEELRVLLGKGRSRKGIFEGDLHEGELEIGQVSGSINHIKSVNEIMDEILKEFRKTLEESKSNKFNF